jgi:hypothetical protein
MAISVARSPPGGQAGGFEVDDGNGLQGACTLSWIARRASGAMLAEMRLPWAMPGLSLLAGPDLSCRSLQPGASGRLRSHAAYCTLAATAALSLSVNVQLRTLLPPLEHVPDHTASRPLLTLSVIAVPAGNDAAPVLPTATLMPAGFDVTRSPLRPLARRSG